jgi:hypothetical protein
MVRRAVHLAPGHICHHCGIRVKSSNEFRFHLQYKCEKFRLKRTKPTSFSCSDCPAVFKQQRTLNSHVQGHTEVFSVAQKCLVCGWGTAKSGSLTKHIPVHNKV